MLYGLAITPERLRQVEEGEAFLRSLGVSGDLRVRHHGAKARLEVAPDQMDRVRANWERDRAEFGSLGFDAVELDPAGYRRGGLLAIARSHSRLMRLFAAVPIPDPAREQILEPAGAAARGRLAGAVGAR